jgi:hypothetical protein
MTIADVLTALVEMLRNPNPCMFVSRGFYHWRSLVHESSCMRFATWENAASNLTCFTFVNISCMIESRFALLQPVERISGFGYASLGLCRVALILMLLFSPSDSGAVGGLAEEYLTNRQRYEDVARDWTWRFAR